MVVFRGNGSIAMKRDLVHDGNLSLPLPASAGGGRLTVVPGYKHLGSKVCADASVGEDAVLRSGSALAAFAPLAVRVFGSPKLDRHLKLQFAESLVFSRLFYSVATWANVSKFAVTQLNKVYMQTLRRIAGQCRFRAE
eukprot:3110766-Karenia_brevis.AAC.1